MGPGISTVFLAERCYEAAVTRPAPRAWIAPLLALLSACANAGGSGRATADCRASCPDGAEWDGQACRWSAASVQCPPGSRFQGKQCVPTERAGDVQVQVLIDGSTIGKNKKALLEKDLEAKQKELDQLQERLLAEKEAIESGKLGAAALKARRAKYERDLGELKQALEKYERDLRAKERALTSEILTHIRRAAESVARAQGIGVVYFEDDVLWVEPGSEAIAQSLRGIVRVDLTNAVLEQMNQK